MKTFRRLRYRTRRAMYNGMLFPWLSRLLITNILFQVFSAPNYVDQAGNRAAFVRLQLSSAITHSHDIPCRSGSMPQATRSTRNTTLCLTHRSSPWPMQWAAWPACSRKRLEIFTVTNKSRSVCDRTPPRPFAHELSR